MKLSDRPRRLAGPQHGRFHFGFGRSPWAVRFLLTNDDSDNAFAVYAFMLFEAQPLINLPFRPDNVILAEFSGSFA
jgi:hypothetical protein